VETAGPLRGHFRSTFGPAALSPDGKYAFLAHDHSCQVVHAMDTATGKELGTYLAPTRFDGLTITPDGKHLLLADRVYNTVMRVPVPVVLEVKPLSRKELMTPRQ
jgi:hypothetical protein